jgi:hypothetical protein
MLVVSIGLYISYFAWTYEDTGNEPNNGRQEAECLGSFPSGAKIVVKEPTPVEHRTARRIVYGVDQETKGCKPAEGYDDINCHGELERDCH